MMRTPFTPTDERRDPAQVADQVGAVASSLCAVHCALCAAAPAVFTALGLGAWLSHEVELGLTLVAVLFGVLALRMGWRHHRSSVVLGVLLLGIAGLLASRVQEMSGEHHSHHGDHVHAVHDEAAGQDGEHGEHDEHDEHDGHAGHTVHDVHDGHEEATSHLAGEALGILAGLLLCVGHILNLRATRRCRRACCDGSDAGTV